MTKTKNQMFPNNNKSCIKRKETRSKKTWNKEINWDRGGSKARDNREHRNTFHPRWEKEANSKANKWKIEIRGHPTLTTATIISIIIQMPIVMEIIS